MKYLKDKFSLKHGDIIFVYGQKSNANVSTVIIGVVDTIRRVCDEVTEETGNEFEGDMGDSIMHHVSTNGDYSKELETGGISMLNDDFTYLLDKDEILHYVMEII